MFISFVCFHHSLFWPENYGNNVTKYIYIYLIFLIFRFCVFALLSVLLHPSNMKELKLSIINYNIKLYYTHNTFRQFNTKP